MAALLRFHPVQAEHRDCTWTGTIAYNHVEILRGRIDGNRGALLSAVAS